MIRQAKARLPPIERIQFKLIFNAQPSLVAESPIRVYNTVHFGDAVFGEYDTMNSTIRKKFNQDPASSSISDRLLRLWIIRSVSLQIVVKLGR